MDPARGFHQLGSSHDYTGPSAGPSATVGAVAGMDGRQPTSSLSSSSSAQDDSSTRHTQTTASDPRILTQTQAPPRPALAQSASNQSAVPMRSSESRSRLELADEGRPTKRARKKVEPPSKSSDLLSPLLQCLPAEYQPLLQNLTTDLQLQPLPSLAHLNETEIHQLLETCLGWKHLAQELSKTEYGDVLSWKERGRFTDLGSRISQRMRILRSALDDLAHGRRRPQASQDKGKRPQSETPARVEPQDDGSDHEDGHSSERSSSSSDWAPGARAGKRKTSTGQGRGPRSASQAPASTSMHQSPVPQQEERPARSPEYSTYVHGIHGARARQQGPQPSRPDPSAHPRFSHPSGPPSSLQPYQQTSYRPPPQHRPEHAFLSNPYSNLRPRYDDPPAAASQSSASRPAFSPSSEPYLQRPIGYSAPQYPPSDYMQASSSYPPAQPRIQPGFRTLPPPVETSHGPVAQAGPSSLTLSTPQPMMRRRMVSAAQERAGAPQPGLGSPYMEGWPSPGSVGSPASSHAPTHQARQSSREWMQPGPPYTTTSSGYPAPPPVPFNQPPPRLMAHPQLAAPSTGRGGLPPHFRVERSSRTVSPALRSSSWSSEMGPMPGQRSAPPLRDGLGFPIQYQQQQQHAYAGASGGPPSELYGQSQDYAPAPNVQYQRNAVHQPPPAAIPRSHPAAPRPQLYHDAQASPSRPTYPPHPPPPSQSRYLPPPRPPTSSSIPTYLPQQHRRITPPEAFQPPLPLSQQPNAPLRAEQQAFDPSQWETPPGGQTRPWAEGEWLPDPPRTPPSGEYDFWRRAGPGGRQQEGEQEGLVQVEEGYPGYSHDAGTGPES